jgi:hypothetical protein
MKKAFLLAASAVAAAAQSGPNLALATCSAAKSSSQVFTFDAVAKTFFTSASAAAGQKMCWDIEDFSTADNATVYTWPCGQDGAGSNEQWAVTATR